MKPHVARITELNPRLRRIHVVGENHPGELANRGYAAAGGEWIKEIPRPKSGDADPFVNEFRALHDLGYAFLEGAEWSPAEMYRRYRDAGLLPEKAVFIGSPPGSP